MSFIDTFLKNTNRKREDLTPLVLSVAENIKDYSQTVSESLDKSTRSMVYNSFFSRKVKDNFSFFQKFKVAKEAQKPFSENEIKSYLSNFLAGAQYAHDEGKMITDKFVIVEGLECQYRNSLNKDDLVIDENNPLNEVIKNASKKTKEHKGEIAIGTSFICIALMNTRLNNIEKTTTAWKTQILSNEESAISNGHEEATHSDQYIHSLERLFAKSDYFHNKSNLESDDNYHSLDFREFEAAISRNDLLVNRKLGNEKEPYLNINMVAREDALSDFKKNLEEPKDKFNR